MNPLDCGESIVDWTGQAFEDAYSWTKDAFSDLGDAFEDVGEWIADGENWKNLGDVIVSPITNTFGPGREHNDTFGTGEHSGISQAEMCKSYEPQPGEPIPGNYYGDTFTEDFNYQLIDAGVSTKVIYGAFGDIHNPSHRMVSTRDCEAVDCLNPCYEDGSCYNCTRHLFENEGARIDACNDCTVPTRSR